MKTQDCEMWLCVDANGDYATGVDSDTAVQAYENDIGELNATEGFRLVKVVVKVPLPVVVELTGEVSEEEPGKLVSAS